MSEYPRDSDDVLRWARIAEFSAPPRWGDVEGRILSVPAPTGNPAPGPNPLSGIPLYVVGVLMYALPVAGLGLVVARGGGEITDSATWARAGFAAFLISLVIPVVTWEMWRSSGRRRRPFDVVVTVVSGISSAISFFLLQSGSSDLGGPPLLFLTAVSAVAAIVVLALLLLFSAGWRRHTPRRLRPRTREDRSYNNVRARVLEVLVKRGVVKEDDVDISAMLDMPIGSWEQLDARV